MTDVEKLDMLKALYGETDDSDDVLSAYLVLAGKKILVKAFPYDNTQTEVPAEYEHLQIEIAIYLLNKRGAEGQTGHTENGITRSYGGADVPAAMLSSITPHIGVIK